MKHETVNTEITVIGGGLSGVCAAVAAARLGQTVALVQNRPVLGGNSSSEVRVWVAGATAGRRQKYARENGIIGEMLLDNQYRNPEGNPYYWDLVVLDTVLAESNIQLFLNTDVHEVEAEGADDDRVIRTVTGWMTGSERKIRFQSELYLDCTGDGLVGFLAGAKYRIGREARQEYGEDHAPEQADSVTLGSTMFFYTKDAGRPVKYVPPSFAKDITKTSIPPKLIRTGANGCDYWWIEWGGEVDAVHDNEQIRDELWSVIYGIWDYIKNSGQFDADRLMLEWVGSVPGKREYRRFIGDYMLHGNDILQQTPFADQVAFGGWSIDLHSPKGMYGVFDPPEGGKPPRNISNGVYAIPFRSLYSVNVRNMLMAGRNISATHVAFGSTRVMATCAVIGEAAGTGAALCRQYGVMPRELHDRYLPELQQVLLRQDASVIGLRNRDYLDKARKAHVRASSVLSRLAVEDRTETMPLEHDVAILFPVEPCVETLEVLVDAASEGCLEVELWSTEKPENYIPHALVAQDAVPVRAGGSQWITVKLPWRPQEAANAFLIVKANPSLKIGISARPLTGVLSMVCKKPNPPWSLSSFEQLQRKTICFRLCGETAAYAPEKAINGLRRPYEGPQMWVSQPIATGGEEWLELAWEKAERIREAHLIFNDDSNEFLNNLHFKRTPFDVIPELVRDYRLEGWSDGTWIVLHRETGNRMRKRVHPFAPIVTNRLRIVIERTNGCPRAELIEARVYE